MVSPRRLELRPECLKDTCTTVVLEAHDAVLLVTTARTAFHHGGLSVNAGIRIYPRMVLPSRVELE
jgi:hypothetical protein